MPADLLSDRALNRATLARQHAPGAVRSNPACDDRAPGRHAGAGARQPLRRALVAPRSLRPGDRVAAARDPEGRADRRDAGHDPSRQRRRLPAAPAARPAGPRSRARAALGVRRRRSRPPTCDRCWRSRDGCSPGSRRPGRSSAPRSPRASPTSTRPHSRTPAATISPSSRSRRGACGVAAARSRRPPRSRGSGDRSSRTLRSTTWCCGTSARSDRPPSPTSRPGRGSPACARSSSAYGRGCEPSSTQRGRELFDLPDAPRPDPEVPAPARFLPEYDNVLLSHADRTRFSHDTSGTRIGNGRRTVHGTVLFDGRVHATWRIERDAGRAACALVVSHLEISKRGLAQIAAEGRRFLRFTEPGAADRVVRFEALP